MISKYEPTSVMPNGTVNILLLAGVLLASLAEGLTGTALSLGRLAMLGDLYTTPDEFSLLDIGYTAAKLCGVMGVPALFARFLPMPVLVFSSCVLTATSMVMTCTTSLFPLVLTRIVQGAAGGVILAGGQALLFTLFNQRSQPFVQLFFAFGAVVAPATFASFFQGLMIDLLAWEVIFFAAALLGLTAFFILSRIPFALVPRSGTVRSDLTGFLVFATAAVCLTYVAQEGNRWNWFEADHVLVSTVVGISAFLFCVMRWAFFPRQEALVCPLVFGYPNFCFGFIISFVAGMALFGSATMIPGFTLNVLHFTATEAGYLNAVGGISFCVALVGTALLLYNTHVNPLVTVPLGIVLFMIGMWQFSGSTSHAGSAEFFIPVLIRGAGLGFLFLSLTIFTLGNLTGGNIAQGTALFTANRQLGGLFGVAILQRYMEHQNAHNISILSSYVEAGNAHVAERLQSLQTILQGRGMESGDATKAAMALLQKNLHEQGSVISFNEIFFAIILIFIVAIPLLVIFKIWLSKKFSGNMP